jgi:putative ABC transport system ATP-binding protein
LAVRHQSGDARDLERARPNRLGEARLRQKAEGTDQDWCDPSQRPFQHLTLHRRLVEADDTIPGSRDGGSRRHLRTQPVSVALSVSHVTKTYARGPSVTALHDISITLEAGRRLAIVGPSGSGKTTLLNVMGGLDVPTTGRVVVGGIDLADLNEADRSRLRRTHLSYVFQASHLLPTLTCEENVAMPLYLHSRPAPEIRARVSRALADVGLGARATHLPDELSGGECQRAAIARALVIDPQVILADEPTGQLDTATGERVLAVLVAATTARGATLVIVTHDAAVLAHCDRVIRLRDGAMESDSEAPVPC